MEYIKDYITGDDVPNRGAEENRQIVEHILVDEKGFDRADIRIDEKFSIYVENSLYETSLDLVVIIEDYILAAFKIVAGSISSWEREIVAGARILVEDYQIPFSIVTDGRKADIFDTVTGKKISSGLENIPARSFLENFLKEKKLQKYPKERLERQKMVFRTYDMLNVNR